MGRGCRPTPALRSSNLMNVSKTAHGISLEGSSTRVLPCAVLEPFMRLDNLEVVQPTPFQVHPYIPTSLFAAPDALGLQFCVSSHPGHPTCVKSLRSFYTGLYPQSCRAGKAPCARLRQLSYRTQSVLKVVLQKSISTQIRQLIPYVRNSEG